MSSDAAERLEEGQAIRSKPIATAEIGSQISDAKPRASDPQATYHRGELSHAVTSYDRAQTTERLASAATNRLIDEEFWVRRWEVRQPKFRRTARSIVVY
jgi:hypothetical protein